MAIHNRDDIFVSQVRLHRTVSTKTTLNMKNIILFVCILLLTSCMSNRSNPSPELVATRTAIAPTATSETQPIHFPFADDFSDNRLNWPTGSWEDDYKSNEASIGPDKLSIRMKSKKAFFNRIYPRNAPAIPASDAFTYSLDTHIKPVSRKQGIGISLIETNGQQGLSHEFTFWVTGREYYFGHRANRVGKAIIGYTLSTAINPNGDNTLALELHGKTFTLKINGQKVAAIDVDEIEQVQSFQAGIVCSQDQVGATTQFEFDNYEIQQN